MILVDILTLKYVLILLMTSETCNRFDGHVTFQGGQTIQIGII